jgi:hypothetical protein
VGVEYFTYSGYVKITASHLAFGWLLTATRHSKVLKGLGKHDVNNKVERCWAKKSSG